MGGTYCEGAAKVNGKSIGSCLGDLFSISWMEDDDAKDTTKETLETQWQVVKQRTNKSKVMQWSDLSFKNDFVSEFIGSKGHLLNDASDPGAATRLESAVSVRELDLNRWYHLYNSAETGEVRQQMGVELQRELLAQQRAESAYRRFAEVAYPGDEDAQKAARRLKHKPDYMECEMDAHKAFAQYCDGMFDANSAFALQFHQVVVNVCHDIASGLNLAVVPAVEQACAFEDRIVV